MKPIEEEFPPEEWVDYQKELRKLYTRLRARAVEMERAQQWRPIAEAEKDGHILAAAIGQYRPWVAMWSNDRWFVCDHHANRKPTHFRPLPPAPDTHQP